MLKCEKCPQKATKITKTIDKQNGKEWLFRECEYHYRKPDKRYFIEKHLTEAEYLALTLEAAL
jgi:hypothetical protein